MRRSFVSPRSAVAAAVAVLVALACLIVARVIGGSDGAARAATPSRGSTTSVAAATVPATKPILLDQLAIPCWSCQFAEAWPLRFRTDLDLIAPLGTGGSNAAEWFAAFTQPDGARAGEAKSIMTRLIDHPTIGRILPANDPFLAEARPWLDQAAMRFYPEVHAVEGLETKIPNLMLALTLARSLLARGQSADRFEDAMADFQRVVRLGRLLRQDDVLVYNDLVGLAVIRIGADAIYDRARKEGRLDMALAAAVIAGEVSPQRLLSGARMTSIEVAPYLRRGNPGSSITLPDNRFEGLRKIALNSPDRRFRLESCVSLSLIATFGSGDRRKQAKQVLEALADSTDTVVASNARWHLANPMDEKHLDQLLAQKE
jgi:hypothetical protein